MKTRSINCSTITGSSRKKSLSQFPTLMTSPKKSCSSPFTPLSLSLSLPSRGCVCVCAVLVECMTWLFPQRSRPRATADVPMSTD
ncbi:hypothetical protein GBAR_LOCUS26999 [Geodia barretti]|uniref:Uncharacterized protein n=1 Tax=Geodia barretti TaxID=519541 RepID=A0AA35XE41_GEOBA|nr:hypothetical protein GBAR_LOCUS26999 [Geodia barretti]